MVTKARILAVDDDPRNLAVIAEALEGLHDCKLVECGKNALEIAPSYLPDVVLLDIMMPDINGYKVCAKLKDDPRLMNTRVVLVSARVAPEDRRIGYHYGADEYLTKPFSEDELIGKLNVVLEAKQAEYYKQSEKELARIWNKMGEVLALMTTLAGAEGKEHLLKIRNVTRLLGEQVGVDRSVLLDVSYASVLHDIGMIAVPRDISHWNDKLSAREAEDLRSHTLLGEYLLNQIASHDSANKSFFRIAANIARSHHENWDGSGFPDGRQAESIPLEGRLVRVAHAVDERIESVQRTREVVDAQLVMEPLYQGAGKKYDPQIVSACGDVIDVILSLYTTQGSAACMK